MEKFAAETIMSAQLLYIWLNKLRTYFCFHICVLAVSSTTSNFLDIDQEVQLFASVLISSQVYFTRQFTIQKGLNHVYTENFPMHSKWGILGGH